MQLLPKSPVGFLAEFSRLVSDIQTPHEVLPLLIDAAINIFKADGAMVFKVDREDAKICLVAYKQVPKILIHYVPEPGVIGSDLVKELMDLSQDEFAYARPFPLVSNKDLYGNLVLFYQQNIVLCEEKISFIETYANLSAIALGKSDQYLQLEKSHRELQASQEILIRNEKLRALGEMSASITHDMGNLLTPLFVYVNLIKKISTENPQAIMVVEKFEKSLELMLETTNRIKNFSRQSTEKNPIEMMDLNLLCKEAIDIVKSKLDSKIFLATKLMENLPLAPIQTSEFISAMVNLLYNAIDVLVDKGEIIICSGVRDGGVWISISDNGPGMTEELQKNIFKPFFTTKGKKGTGLGLSMVAAFMHQNNGTIKVESEVGKGTTFTLWFPTHSANQ